MVVADLDLRLHHAGLRSWLQVWALLLLHRRVTLGERILELVYSVKVHVSREHRRVGVRHDIVSRTHLLLTHLHEKNGRTINHSLQHRDGHHKDEDCADADFCSTWISLVVGAQVPQHRFKCSEAAALLRLYLDFGEEDAFGPCHLLSDIFIFLERV